MTSIFYRNKRYSVKPEETVLNALLRQSVDVSFSCENGICQVCLLRTDNQVPESAQAGLSDSMKSQGYFLACVYQPKTDLFIYDEPFTENYYIGVVQDKKALSIDIWQITIDIEKFAECLPGQFINIRYQGVVRSYSVAKILSVPKATTQIRVELIIQHYPQGKVSEWLCQQALIGDFIEVSTAKGSCYYSDEHREQDLILVATGTGIANTLGVLRGALESGHQKSILFIHGVRQKHALIFRDELEKLSKQIANLHYVPCVSRESDKGVYMGRVTNIAFSDQINPKNTRYYLAGSDDMVTDCRNKALAIGVKTQNILCDAHTIFMSDIENSDSKGRSYSSISSSEEQTAEVDYPEPIPELWSALGEGLLLRKILDDFYDQVFEDPILSPYFHNSTKDRAKEKVFSFYKRIFSGEQVYFGDRPRNAHHWMVISDDIFNYRMMLLESKMKKFALSETHIKQWLKVEELYRSDIVKDKTWGRRVGDIELPSEGFAEEVMDIGGLCDACESEIAPGTKVKYHLRTGKVYCFNCRGESTTSAQEDTGSFRTEVSTNENRVQLAAENK